MALCVDHLVGGGDPIYAYIYMQQCFLQTLMRKAPPLYKRRLYTSSCSNSRGPHYRRCPKILEMPFNSGKVTPPLKSPQFFFFGGGVALSRFLEVG